MPKWIRKQPLERVDTGTETWALSNQPLMSDALFFESVEGLGLGTSCCASDINLEAVGSEGGRSLALSKAL